MVLVGEDPASQVYVRNKVAACEKAGLHSVKEQYPADMTEADLLARIDTLNRDPAIHGILVQLPLPKHMDAHKVIEAIAAEKDVDGFHVSNAGLLMTGQPLFRPCTPYGVMKMLESEGVALRGAEAVIVGASNIVGKPMAMLLLQAGATITICNSKTRDRPRRRADVLVVATGKPGMIDGSMIKPGAVVIDVGINRGADGKLCGDVDFASASRWPAPSRPCRAAWPHDHRHAAGQHGRGRRARGRADRLSDRGRPAPLPSALSRPVAARRAGGSQPARQHRMFYPALAFGPIAPTC